MKGMTKFNCNLKQFKFQLWHVGRIHFSIGIDFSLPMGMRLKDGRVVLAGTCWDWAEADFPDKALFVEGRIVWFGGISMSYGLVERFSKDGRE